MRHARGLTILGVLVLAAACAPRLGVFLLPPNAVVVSPDAGVPAREAVLSGAWGGTWLSPGWGPGFDGLLVVERIEGDEASILYAWGKAEAQADKGWYRQRARILPGPLLEWTRGDWSFQFRPQSGGKTLDATVRGKSVDATAIADFTRIDPRALARALPVPARPAPPLPAVPPLATVPPAPDLPGALAGFWGRWEGTWDSGVASRLIVTEVNRAAAKVLYSWSADPNGKFRGGEEESLALAYPEQRKITWGSRPAFTFRLSPDGRSLRGESDYNGDLNAVLMQRVSP